MPSILVVPTSDLPEFDGCRWRVAVRPFVICLGRRADGVFLPATGNAPNPTGAVVHRGATLTDEYINYVNSQLSVAESQEQALEILSFIKADLLAGKHALEGWWE